jgi:PAS domain S-box-containing protein
MDVEPKDCAENPMPDLLRLCRPVAERSALPMAVVEGTTPILRYVNRAFCRLFGRKSEELIGKPFAETVPEGKACLALLNRVYRTGEAETYTKPELGESHTDTWSYVMWPVLGGDERPVGVMIQVNETTLLQQQAAAMNQSLLLSGIRQHELTEAAEKQAAQLQLEIDERKRVETALRESEEHSRQSAEELRKSHEELELRVEERTAELGRKNRELQEFAFVASHDLREPLRKIQTFGDLLKSKGSDHLSEMEMDYISRMSGAANRMQELLDALLRYSRVESKGQDSGPTRLNDIVKDAVADLEVPIQNTKARVEIGHLPQVNGDPQQLRQLFQNLVANALKYHRPDVNTLVRIYAKRNDGTARIFVEDNGIGFDERYLDKIFQPFQRLHGKHEYPGTGIGLAICQKIVERHKGSITARSTPGKGSTFIITLPIKKGK